MIRLNKNDYITQVDSIEFSPNLEAKLIDGVELTKPKKKHFALPLSLAASILLVIAVIAIPALKAKNGIMTDGSAVETEDFKDKSTAYTSYSENYLADVAGGTTEDAHSSPILLWNRLVLNHDDGKPLSKAEYEAECERLCELGYEAVVSEEDGDICINIAIHPYDAENFTDTNYKYKFTNITE